MKNDLYEVQSSTLFSKSLIWELNRKFYQQKGITAWSDEVVPHHMTSNSSVGKTYAHLILAFLKDLSSKGCGDETVYIIELGAGHGRLAYHILKHLQSLFTQMCNNLPPFCYILSDIAESNLSYFSDHPQLQFYYEQGLLDLAYYDAIETESLSLRKSNKTINIQSLNQPIIALTNYFFDSIPSELFFINDHTISECFVSLQSKQDPTKMAIDQLIKGIELSYEHAQIELPHYGHHLFDSILERYGDLKTSTYIYFPLESMKCISRLKDLSKTGLLLLTMDKGFHEEASFSNIKSPDVVTHGSFSLWVNYHAIDEYCKKSGGKTMFPTFSNFHMEVGCLLFLQEKESYVETELAYKNFINDFGPDDFNSLKQIVYANASQLQLIELLAFFRLSDYDSTIFINFLPVLKQSIKEITYKERFRLTQTLDKVWELYFYICENFDLAYEIGGLFYDLGFYSKSLIYFQHSIDIFGEKADVLYNRALCYYQLRQDHHFYSTIDRVRQQFPNSEFIVALENLKMD